MNTRPSTSISIPEILLLIALAITILLPRPVLPFGLLAAGGGYLLYLVIHSIRSHVLPKSSFGPASAALFMFVFGICLLVIPTEILLALVITIVVTLIVQMVWVVLRNRLVGR